MALPVQLPFSDSKSAFDSSSPPQSSFTPPTSTPYTGLSPSPEQFTPPPITRQRRTILVTMGPCNVQGQNGYWCPCTFGSCTSDWDAGQAICDSCMHPMSMHSDYASPATLNPTTSSHAQSRMITPFQLSPYVNARTKLVDEMISRVQHYHIIQVRGTPASGKTTVMKLVANKLLKEYGQTTSIYTLWGWWKKDVDAATGWNEYLRRQTGVRGYDWCTYPAYLLLDEAQESHWDSELWAGLFKSIERVSGSSPFIILFSSYGSPGRGFAGYDKKHTKTPMVFAAGQQISMRQDENIEDYLPTLLPSWRPVGLLLDEDEAINIVTRYVSVVQPSLSITADLKKEFFLISSGHVGLLIDLVDLLKRVPGIHDLVRGNISLDSQTISKYFFGQALNLFTYLRDTPFTRGLPSSEVLQDITTATVFKKAIAEDGILSKSNFENESEEFEVLEKIWRNGWLHAEKSKIGVRYVFATQIHRWYCHCLFEEMKPDGEINYDTPLRLAVDAIKQFRPRQLSNPPRSLTGNTRPLEDQYQKEFYRCLFTMLDGHVETSPEFVVKAGTKGGGTIDFFIAQKKWGLELLRDRDRLVEHMKRFEPDGQYFSMMQSKDMEQYIVLDFTVTQPRDAHLGYRGHLYHVVFSENYREVNVIDAYDLSVVESFALTENAHPIA